jgi:hypothetical protein
VTNYLKGSSAGDSRDDSLFDYILPACTRICKALGQRFTPYLQYVMPPILHAAVAVVQFTMEDAEDGATVGEVRYTINHF